MLRKLFLFILIAMLSVFSLAARAEGVQTGKVTAVYVRATDGLTYFYLDGPAAVGKPTCAAGKTYWMIKDETSPVGKQHLAMLLLAQTTGRTVKVSGWGTCTRWIDGEDTAEIGIAP
jgi:hypothetical protein